jgi:hypothetical protein
MDGIIAFQFLENLTSQTLTHLAVSLSLLSVLHCFRPMSEIHRFGIDQCNWSWLLQRSHSSELPINRDDFFI